MTVIRFVLGSILLTSLAEANIALHGPRDRFWRHHREQRSLMVNGVNQFEAIEKCLDNLLTAEDREAMKIEEPKRRVGTTFEDEEKGGWTFFVAVEDAMAPSHVKAVQALASCVREIIPSSYESRPMFIEFELDEDIGLGGNCPTHLAPLVGVFLPEVADAMQRTLEVAFEAAGWSEYTVEKGHPADSENVLPEPKDVGFRACEHLTYKDFKKDGLSDHNDGSDTYYTMNYAFSGPEDYDGGYFYIKHYGKPALKTLYYKPKKYDALIFLGGKYDHGVTEIMSGNREMFSSELWDYPDSPFGSNLWSNYADRMDEYIELCDIEAENGHEGPCQVAIDKVFVARETKNKANGVKEDNDDGEEEEDTDDKDQFEENDDGEEKKYSGLVVVRVRDSERNEFSLADFRSLEEPYFLIKQNMSPGEIHPIWWRDLTSFHSDDYLVVGLPDKLVEEFQTFAKKSGLNDVAQKVLYQDKRIVPQGNRMYTLRDGTKWTATMLGEWASDVIRLEPNDEKGSSVFPPLLKRGNFDMVMEKLSRRLDLSGLIVRGVDVAIVSKVNGDSIVSVDSDLDEANYRVVIPVHIPAGMSSVLALGEGSDEEKGNTWGLLNQKVGVGLVGSSESSYVQADCNYKKEHEFQMSFTVYLDEHDEISTSYA